MPIAHRRGDKIKVAKPPRYRSRSPPLRSGLNAAFVVDLTAVAARVVGAIHRSRVELSIKPVPKGLLDR